jgi:hypothetical protein
MKQERYQEKTKQHIVDVLANGETNTDLSETLMFASMSSS